jgi:hypothetical protein
VSTLSRLLPHQRALAQGLAPKHATSPKDLGTYSPREILMRKPISAHEFLLPCTCFGFCLSNQYREQESPQAREATLRPQEGSAPSGKSTPSTRPKSRQAKSSARAPQKFFSLSRAPVAPRAVFSLLHSMDCSCVKGEPSSTATREPLPLQALNTPRPCRVTLRHTAAAVS